MAVDSLTANIPRRRLGGWVALVLAIALVNYAGRIAGGEPDRDILYRYSTAVGGVVQYAIILALVLLIARGLDRREVFALRQPQSWGRAVALVIGAMIVVWVVGVALNAFLKAGEEQGLVPDRWESSKAGAYAANFVVVALVAPVVEELMFRGLGYTLLGTFYGPTAAVFGTAGAFAVYHGLFVALPLLAFLGVVLAILRKRTDSIYTPILLHSLFNAIALVAAVTVAKGGT